MGQLVDRERDMVGVEAIRAWCSVWIEDAAATTRTTKSAGSTISVSTGERATGGRGGGHGGRGYPASRNIISVVTQFLVLVAFAVWFSACGRGQEEPVDESAADGASDFRVGGLPSAEQIATEVAMLRALPAPLDPSSEVGTIAGSAGVGARGQATWTTRIEVAPGVATMTPELSITYDGARGNGPLGWGFDLAGLSSVTRCSRTIIEDGAEAPLSWTNQDATRRLQLR
ncbi:MAG: SpvB/TcaC N-terminal domain-containing protein [Nannocystaceae bacterium]